MSTNDKRVYDVYGIGNALVDFEYRVTEAFLRDNDIARGHTTLVDAEQMADIRERLDGHDTRRTSGGSAANTAYAVAAFGGRAFYAAASRPTKTAASFCANSATPASVPNRGERPEGVTGAACRW